MDVWDAMGSERDKGDEFDGREVASCFDISQRILIAISLCDMIRVNGLSNLRYIASPAN